MKLEPSVWRGFRIAAPIGALCWIGLFLLFTGCTVNKPYQITEVYAPVEHETIITVPRQALMGQCLRRGSYEKCAQIDGMARYMAGDLGKRCVIYLAEELEPWKRACILNHERKHCQVGNFHPGKRYNGCQ